MPPCVALESSVEGAVPLTQDELTHGEPLLITAEAYVPITFDLLVRPGTELADDPDGRRAPARPCADPGLAGQPPCRRPRR